MYFVLASGIFLNMILPQIIHYPELINQLVLYLSIVLMISQFYLFYVWIYGMWTVSKVLRDIGDENIFILFFLSPFYLWEKYIEK